MSSGEDIQPRWKIKYNLINDYLDGEIANHHTMIGDTDTDIIAGNNLGFTTIRLLCGISSTKLIDSKPDKILNHSSELMEHIFLKILITGGAGFIGSHIADSLNAAGHDIVIYDNFSTGLMENIEEINAKNIKLINGDILDFNKLVKAMKGVDIVSHHAAQLEIFVGIDEPEKDLSINTVGTLNVLNAAKNNVKKVINASSACIYGQTDKETTENDLTDPNWAYGVSKLAAEKYANIFQNTRRISQ